MVKQQKPKPTYCKVCGSLDIYNGEHDMCRAIDVAKQQTALATYKKCLDMVRKMLNIKTCNNYLPEDMFSDIEVEIKKLQNEN